MTLPFQVDLSGKTAVVTGGSGVLCSCMAGALVACGARTAVLGRSDETVGAAVAEITRDGGTAIGVPCDVTDKASLDAAYARIQDEFGPCDILINGAGGNNPRATTAVERMSPEQVASGTLDQTFYGLSEAGVRMVFGVNFVGTFLATQVFSKDMASGRGGCIVNISSMSAYTPLTKIPAYSAAKAAVQNFTQWLAVHLAPVNVRVNAIAPGFFLTRQNQDLLTRPDGSLTERGGTIASQTPMGRFGQPHELLGATLWLVCEQASGFVTGTVIPVDGGFNAFSGV